MEVSKSSAELFDEALQYQISGKLTEALALWNILMQRGPSVVQVCVNHGAVCLGLEQHAEALGSFQKAAALRPDDADIQNIMGVALHRLGRADEALLSYQRATALNPLLVEAHYNCGIVAQSQNRLEEALASYARVTQLCPDLAEAHDRCGAMRQLLSRFAGAMADYDQALALEPSNPRYLYDRASCLSAQAHYEEALAGYDRAIALKGDFFAAHSNRALALMEMNRPQEALHGFDDALALMPGHPGTECWKALVLLSQGNFREGLAHYEARALPGGPIFLPNPVARPYWSGAETLAGKSLLLHAEQGLGDTIQFSRYAKLASGQGARVFLSAPARLMRLLGTLSPDIQIVDEAGTLPDCDYQAMLMSMPLAFGTEVDTIPAEPAYLSADRARTEAWAAKIGTHGFRVGLAWHGDIRPLSDHRRTLPLAQLADVAKIPGLRLVSLQKGAGTEQLDTLPAGMVVETLGPDFDEGPDAFLDCAAVMQSLDLVITSDNAIAHLAGALGRPVWLALKHVPEWRWLKDRDDSPWYPGMRLFRQPVRGDWDAVFADIHTQLLQLLAR